MLDVAQDAQRYRSFHLNLNWAAACRNLPTSTYLLYISFHYFQKNSFVYTPANLFIFKRILLFIACEFIYFQKNSLSLPFFISPSMHKLLIEIDFRFVSSHLAFIFLMHADATRRIFIDSNFLRSILLIV